MERTAALVLLALLHSGRATVAQPAPEPLPTTAAAIRRGLQEVLDGNVLPGNEVATLPVSSEGTLLLLTKISTTGKTTPAGRSYDGYPWEGVQPTTIEFNCSAETECSAMLPAPDNPMTEDIDESQDNFRINIIETPQPATDEEAAARFLLHAAFGPKKSEVLELANDPAGLPAAMQSWIEDQLEAVWSRPYSSVCQSKLCPNPRVRWPCVCHSPRRCTASTYVAVQTQNGGSTAETVPTPWLV